MMGHTVLRLRDEHILKVKCEEELQTVQKEATALQEKLVKIKSERSSAAMAISNLQKIQIKLQEDISSSQKEVCNLKCKLKDSNKR